VTVSSRHENLRPKAGQAARSRRSSKTSTRPFILTANQPPNKARRLAATRPPTLRASYNRHNARRARLPRRPTSHPPGPLPALAARTPLATSRSRSSEKPANRNAPHDDPKLPRNNAPRKSASDNQKFRPAGLAPRRPAGPSPGRRPPVA